MAESWGSYDAASTFDEMLTPAGRSRPGCHRTLSRLLRLESELFQRQSAGEAAIRSMGITFSLGAEDGLDRSWPLDLIPRIITATEWARVSEGLIQRLRVLNAFIDDLYHDREVINDGIVPAELIDESPNYRQECRGASVTGGVWAHICGTDLVRDGSGQFLVLEDNLRIPSGVSYMLENRQVSKRVFADLFLDVDIAPVDGYIDRLRGLLQDLAPAADGGEPVIAVLTPGIYNSAYYEHAYLASRLGAHLVEGSDLRVEDDVVFMATINGPVRVDVIYRRVDDEFLDPEVFNPDSVLGAAGLLSAWRAGNVALANAPGAGVADDKVIYSYVPDLVRYYLGQEPILANVETYRLNDPDHRAHVLADLSAFVSKPADGAGGKGLVVGSKASDEQLAELRDEILANPRNWVAQPVLNLSTAPTVIHEQHEPDDTTNGARRAMVAPRHIDLRPFVLSGREPYVTAGGLTRVALRAGSLVVNSSQGGGSKDTWIVDEPDEADAEVDLRYTGDHRPTDPDGDPATDTPQRQEQSQ
jgi:uncharacterized circularly permuted ATP-grasp superfamily protein